MPNAGPWPYGAVFGGPAYWEGPNGHYIFYTSATHPLCRYRLGTSAFGNGASWLTRDAESLDSFATGSGPGYETATPTPAVSSDGKTARHGDHLADPPRGQHPARLQRR